MTFSGEAADATLTLPHALRQRSRQRVRLDNGGDARLYLAQGTVLRHGDRLVSTDGLIVEVRAAAETVSTVRCGRARDQAQVCYHLGNRHVDIQIGEGWVRYLHDHVLDDMMSRQGYEVIVEQRPFEPLTGAYAAMGRGERDDSAS